MANNKQQFGPDGVAVNDAHGAAQNAQNAATWAVLIVAVVVVLIILIALQPDAPDRQQELRAMAERHLKMTRMPILTSAS